MYKSSFLILVLILLLFISPILQFFLITDSFTVGTVIVASLINVIYPVIVNNLNINKRLFYILFYLFFFLILHSLILAVLNIEFDFYRAIGSILILLWLCISSYFISDLLLRISAESVRKIANNVFYVFLIIFVASRFNIVGSSVHDKPIFPFNEPSHFALFFLPFIYFKTLSGKNALLHLSIGLFLAILLQNMTLLIGVALLLLLVYRSKAILPLAGLFFLYIGYLNSDLTYFTERTELSLDSNNLSVLVFLQGWELAINGLIKSYGFGIGFQQLGIVKVPSEATYKINVLLGREANITDAGLTAAKIIAELGVFGILMILIYLKKFIYLALRISNYKDNRLIFICSIYLSFIIELFVRGIGYFNPTIVLVFMTIFLFTRLDNENNLR